MKIKQVLNNNAVLLIKGSNEIVAIANGIGFKRKAGDEVAEHEVEKIFVLDTHDLVEHFSYLLGKVSAQHITVVDEIVQYAQQVLKTTMNDYIYLTLIDHMDYAIQRFSKGIPLKSPLSWEVKNLYKDEYSIGLYGLKLIGEQLGIWMDEEEAVSIALHFVNVQTDVKNMQKTIVITEIMHDILNIVKYQFQIDFNESSLNYIRFVTHLRFFAQRVVNNEASNANEIHELHGQLKLLYRDAFRCVQSIALYLFKKFNRKLTQDEEVYLMIHINRVTQREG